MFYLPQITDNLVEALYSESPTFEWHEYEPSLSLSTLTIVKDGLSTETITNFSEEVCDISMPSFFQ